QNHTDCPLTDFRGKTSIFSHPVYLFLRKFSLQDSRGGSLLSALADFSSMMECMSDSPLTSPSVVLISGILPRK
ncbi:hypothetical protein ACQU2P_004960, partial [Escherichia coli]